MNTEKWYAKETLIVFFFDDIDFSFEKKLIQQRNNYEVMNESKVQIIFAALLMSNLLFSQ